MFSANNRPSTGTKVSEYLPIPPEKHSNSLFEHTHVALLNFLGSKQLIVGSDYEKELDDNDQDQFTNVRRYANASWHHRIFIMLEDPGSSAAGKLWAMTVAIVTVISVLLYIFDSVPELAIPLTSCDFPVCDNDVNLCPGRQLCEPDSHKSVKATEAACIYVFIIDYFSRFLLCGTVPSHLAGCVDSQLQELEPLDLDEKEGDEDVDAGDDDVDLDNSVGKSAHSSSFRSQKADSESSNNLKEIAKERTLLAVEQNQLDDEARRHKELKRLLRQHYKGNQYWTALSEKAQQPDAALSDRLYVAFFRPMTELTYDPEQDPVHSWARQQYLYTFKIMNIIDFVAILPYWLSFMQTKGTSFSVVRVLRVARVLRILKLGKGSKGIPILYNTVKESLPALIILGFFSLIGVVLLGSIIFFFEQGSFALKSQSQGPHFYRLDQSGFGQEISPFNSIAMSMYFIVITSTTVGFGDLTPTSYPGRLVAVVAAYLGMFVLALPISVIGNNFMRFNDKKLGNQSHAVNFALVELVGDSPELAKVHRGYHGDAADGRGKTALSAHEQRRLVVQVASKRLSAVFCLAKALLVGARTQDLLSQMREMHVHLYVDAMVYLEEERLAELLLQGCTPDERVWATSEFRRCSIDEARSLYMPTEPPSEHLVKFIRFEAARTYCHLELETHGGKNRDVVQRLVCSARAKDDPTDRYHAFYNDPEALQNNGEYSELVSFVATLLGETEEEELEEAELHAKTARSSRLTEQLDEVKEALQALTQSLQHFRPTSATIERERLADEMKERLDRTQHVRRKNHGKEIFARILKLSGKNKGRLSGVNSDKTGMHDAGGGQLASFLDSSSSSSQSPRARSPVLSRGKYRPALSSRSAPQLVVPHLANLPAAPTTPSNSNSNSNSNSSMSDKDDSPSSTR